MTETTCPDGLRSVEGLTEWLRAAIAERVRRDPAEIGGGEHFSNYGLDSLRAASVSTALSAALGRRVSPALLWAYPTVDALAAHLLGTPDVATTRRREGPAGLAAARREPIAVVGLACRFPKAGNPEEFWQLLRTGTDAVGVVPPQRWDVDGFVDPGHPNGTTVPGQAGFLDQPLDEFDALFFGISPREAEEMDPQQRLFLEVAWEALEDAGLANEALRGSRTGVFAGAIWHDYADLAGGDLHRLSPYSATGRALNMVANRLSYLLDLRGPSVVVDSACSSSLLAIHLACQSLWSGESSAAIAGGVNLLLNPSVMAALSKFGGLSPDGRCKAFDARADGFGRGEGVGAVVLKPLSRALADDDDIWCTIRASATNNDGFSNGLTAPNPLAQEEVLREAYRRGGVTPADVHYVETHGTGTQLGDPIEAAALGAVFADGRPVGAPLLIGSVKTNLGHLEGAAGIAGLIKAALCLRHRQVAPNVHYETPNPHIAFDELGLRVPRELEPWPQDRPLLAGVSSFGWGGTNVHVVLEGWREPAPLPGPRLTGPDSDEVGERPRIAFVCSPHGHQWAGMGRQMYRTEPVFRAALDQCDRELAHHTGWSVVDELFRDEADAHTEDVDVVQPVLFAIQVALAAWLEAAGVVPGAVVGHSLGEIAAVVIAGILDLPDAARLVHHYSRQQRIVADQDGGMAIVELPAAELEALLSDRRLPVVVAACNGPTSTTLAGELPALEGVLAELKAREVLCGLIRVNVAAHSPAIDPVMVELERATHGMTPRPGRIPMISTVTGNPVRWRDIGPGYFARNLRQTVRLDEAMRILLSDPWDAVLEISAHPVLLSALRQCVDESGRAVTLLGTMRRGEDDRSGPADTLAALAALGARVAVPERSELITLSARTPQALSDLAGRVAASIDAATAPPAVRDVARAAARRADQPYRLAAVAGTAGGFSTALRSYSHGDVPVGLRVSADAAETPPGVAFVFPGQGSQWLGMGRELLAHEPVFHTAIRECDAAARAFVDWSILAELEAGEETSQLERIDVAQPALFAVQVALAALWRSWGVEPIAVVGHSMGEVAAAYVAGALRIEDAARIICLRSRLLRRVSGQGAMLAVELPPDEARRVLAGHEDSVSVAVHNSPRSTVLSGDRRALTRIAGRLERDEVFRRWVKVDVASHSPQMDALSADLRSAIDGLAPRPGTVPLHSTVTGGVVHGADLDERYWVRNLRAPVLFSDQVTRLVRAGVRAFVELSPHPILLPAVEQVAAHVGSDVVTLPSLRRHEPARDTLLGSLGRLYVLGAPIASSRVHTPGRRGIQLPAYPWQRERYWLDERSTPEAAALRPVGPPRRDGAAPEPVEVPELLLGTVAWALGVPAADLDVHESLQNRGLDSLTALAIKDTLSAKLGVALPLVAFLDGHSVEKLCEVVLAALDLSTETGIDGPAVSRGSDDARPILVGNPAARYEPFALTDLQQAYLVGRTNAFELGNVSTYFFLEVDLDDVDLGQLTAAWRQMIARHDMLRAVVSPDGYQRVLADVPPYDIRTADLRDCDDGERTRRLASIHDEMAARVFDTATWPLFDVRATRIDDRRTRLHLGLDVLTIDAWSISLLFREWAAAYRGDGAALPALPVTYRDYVVALHALDGSEERRRAWEYWCARLPTLPPAPELPLAQSPAALTRPRFSHRSDRLTAREWGRFKSRAAAAGVTSSAAVCTAYAEVLAAWSKSSHFTLTVLFFNRLPLHPQVGDIVGNFSTTTLLEVHSTATEGFTVRADRIQKQLWTDIDHSRVSGVEVLRELNRARRSAGRATMPVVFASTVNFESKDDSAALTGVAAHLTTMGASGHEVFSSIRTPQVLLDHQIVEEFGILKINWDVLDELFPAGMVDAMFTAYLARLRELCDDERAWTRPAPVLVPATDLDVRRAVNTTAAPLPEGLLHGGFVRAAAAHPQRTAVIAVGRTLTYGELDGRSNQLDRWLRGQGAGPGALIGVVMAKGWEQIAAALGILKSGAAYVPIDAAVPPERLRLLLANSGISVVLTQTSVDERTSWPDGVVRLAVDSPEAEAESTEPLPASGAAPTALAYVIYTSGSTGVPKGVMIEHAAALNTIEDINERFAVTADDRVLALSAMNFDLSVYDVFGLLSVGGAVVLPEPAAHREPERWAALVAAHHVTVWNSVPTLMGMFTEHALAHKRAEVLPLRLIMMSGDWIPVSLPGRIRELLPDAAVWSLGGATEASIWSILHPIDRVDPGWASIPYGKPMRNQQFHVLNEAMQPCPVWVPGHLYIAGVGLARGYLGDEAKTRAAFIRHPATGERLYRTGDLGRYLPDGNIEFLGREDFQVKIQGHRVELGEVEAALLQCPGVHAAVAAAVGERQGAKRLVAHVVLDSDSDSRDATAELVHSLRRTLPEYLVPQQVIAIGAVPLTENGKVDRSALPTSGGPAGAVDGVTPPRDDVEVALARIWGEFFDASPLGVDTSFFDLGGDSLLAVRLMARIHQRLGRSLPLSTLFAHPTIRHLAAVLRTAAGDTRRSALVPIRSEGTKPPLVFVHPVGGDVLCYAELAALLGDEQPFYAVQLPDTDPPLATVPELAAHYVDEVRAVIPDGPYRLGGWSMGACVALEMAQQLARAGKVVDLVALVDITEPPGARRGRPVDDAILMSWFARDLAGLTGVEWDLSPDVLRAHSRPLEVLYDEARSAGVLPEDIDLDTLDRIVERFSRNFHALLAYEPQPYSGRVLFLRGTGSAPLETAKAWLALFPDDAELVEVAGDHYTLMRPPHVGAVAHALDAAGRALCAG